MEEQRSIRFYMDKSVNVQKRDDIVSFLKECHDVKIQILDVVWGDFQLITTSKNKIDFNYKTKFDYRSFCPRLKSHHFQQCVQDVYATMLSIKNKIINQMKFYYEDSEKAKIYKYCKQFCFEWDRLEKYISKQMKKYKRVDKGYYKFLCNIDNIIKNESLYETMRSEIESKFWECKNKIEKPKLKNMRLYCNNAHTIKLEQDKYYNYYFKLDSNKNVGKSERRGVYEKIIIPIKYSKYHENILKDKTLNNTFLITVNKRGNIEIMASYKVDVDYPEPEEYTDIIGIDIGLKQLVTSSDGEIIDQNKDIIKYAKYINKRKSNLYNLSNHLKEIKGENYIPISNNKLIRQYSKLKHMVECDNRYKIKQFLKGREKDLIVMEDLHISETRLGKETNMLIRAMHIQNIKNDIQKYCRTYGINLELINPIYTSQTCNCCGYTDKKNRKTQERFSCLRCGNTLNADYNASLNIRDRIYINGINLNTPAWEVKKLIEQHYTASD